MAQRGIDTHCNLLAERNTGAESDRIDNRHRKQAMSNLSDFVHHHFDKPADELGDVEKRVLAKAHERKVISTDVNAAFSADASFGERIADSIARIGGSWSFIIAFFVFLVAWTVINTIILVSGAFDPYPFVFLNLILSMLAAIQAPIIMMSQNRQAERDRFEAAKDYEVNLKAELEVLSLHQKIDMHVLTELTGLREDVARLSAALAAKG
ncbi:UNVERIFIED_ORG: putative membrane protein [Rhizobium sophorae]|uniref:Membrane protein n=2 Tax=Rhizobium leguminosarum TaxID=384 RepID=A0A1C9I0E6_RHILT|nr:membrane protein [Rhizobium leguminosarum bv. trifolii]MDH6273323.1 putative membrane protein [Rhizobium leguminosarum]MDH6658065.1 putative membrane protein [Rhizobium sophorae]